jgi:hypothetical protein
MRRALHRTRTMLGTILGAAIDAAREAAESENGDAFDAWSAGNRFVGNDRGERIDVARSAHRLATNAFAHSETNAVHIEELIRRVRVCEDRSRDAEKILGKLGDALATDRETVQRHAEGFARSLAELAEGFARKLATLSERVDGVVAKQRLDRSNDVTASPKHICDPDDDGYDNELRARDVTRGCRRPNACTHPGCGCAV